MNRLTDKRLADASKNGYFIELKKEVNIKHCSVTQLYEKLAEYEDIEEELGIDLIKAIELCKQINSKKVVYTKENWGIDTLKILDELDIELFSHRLYKNAYGIYVSLDLHEYGKTWALTREELEENAE